MTTTDNLTAQIETKVAPKKRGRPAKNLDGFKEVLSPVINFGKHGGELNDELPLLSKEEIEDDKKVDLTKAPNRAELAKKAKAIFADIDLEASNAKRLQEMKNEFSEIIASLIDPLTKMNNFRKKFGL